MTLAQLLAEARRLPTSDRLTLVGELWDSIDPDSVTVSDDEVRLVQERARRLDAHPEEELGWEAFQVLVDERLA